MQHFILIFIGGGLGACARAGFSTQFGKIFHLHSHWAILAVNLLGCLLIGIAAERLLRLDNPAWRLFLISGFLGGFTTYSSFILDFLKLAHSSQSYALLHLAAHLFGGIIACWLGMLIGKGLLT